MKIQYIEGGRNIHKTEKMFEELKNIFKKMEDATYGGGRGFMPISLYECFLKKDKQSLGIVYRSYAEVIIYDNRKDKCFKLKENGGLEPYEIHKN